MSKIGQNDSKEESKTRILNNLIKVTIIIICLTFNITALILIGIAIFAPAWYTVDVVAYNQVKIKSNYLNYLPITNVKVYFWNITYSKKMKKSSSLLRKKNIFFLFSGMGDRPVAIL